jgi:hypothetical protein
VADFDISGGDSRLHRVDAGGIDSVFARGEPSGAQYAGLAAEAHGHVLATAPFWLSTPSTV